MQEERKYPDWLAEGVVYQIYPQSFRDSNGDGIGDIEGIIERMDYIKELGATVLWLNPVFDSPFEDAGYDVRDYFTVAGRYGTNEDLCRLFREAGKRGLRVILDLVAGHTSREHRWFRESMAADSPEADRYIWKNRNFDPGKGPTTENYVHNFFPFQPALNFGYAHPGEPWQDPVDAPGPCRNRQFLRDVLAYWMDKGAAGFRVDMAASLVKEDPDHRETIRLWQDLRQWWDQRFPEGILVAEWSHPAESVKAGFHLDFLMHFNLDAYRTLFFNGTGTLPNPTNCCYFDASGKGTPWEFMPLYAEQLQAVQGRGLISLPSANHDFQRLRCGPRDWEQLPVAWVFLLTQAGPPTIYMGDEIGMRFVPDTPPREGSTLKGLTAPNAGTPIEGERAGSRTPMQWDHSENAGFSTAQPDCLYLPIDPDPDRPTVADQQADPQSLFHFVRGLLDLRRIHPALGTHASYTFLNPEGCDYPLMIERRCPVQRVLIVLNPSARAASAKIPVPIPGHRLLYGKGARLVPSSLPSETETVSARVEGFGYGIFETGSQPSHKARFEKASLSN